MFSASLEVCASSGDQARTRDCRCNREVTQFLFMERALASTARPPGSSTMANTVSALWGKVEAILDPFVSFVNMLPELFFSTNALDQTD
jgi:hypothetical protein